MVLLFAMVFGISTDYGVFLLTRIKEADDAGVPNAEAVAMGLQRTGRIITAAGMLGDASVLRALLVPSLMALLGRWNWWAPRLLRWLYSRAGLSEGAPIVAV